MRATPLEPHECAELAELLEDVAETVEGTGLDMELMMWSMRLLETPGASVE